LYKLVLGRKGAAVEYVAEEMLRARIDKSEWTSSSTHQEARSKQGESKAKTRSE
jgi:hypothetical protein